MNSDTGRRVAAEFFGTFWLTFGGCGAAVLAAGFPALGIGFLGVALAFGLTVLTMAYAVGHISGGHFNPAVTVGLWSAGRCAKHHVLPYIIAQVVGAITAAAVLWMIASGKAGWVPDGFAANGYGNLSPGKYSLPACFVTEALLTFFFVFIIVGTTSKGAAVGFAGIPIGLALTLIHLISIPVTNTSVNPARMDRACVIRWGRVYRTTLAILGGAANWRGHWRHPRPLDVRTGRYYRNRSNRGAAGRMNIVGAQPRSRVRATRLDNR